MQVHLVQDAEGPELQVLEDLKAQLPPHPCQQGEQQVMLCKQALEWTVIGALAGFKQRSDRKHSHAAHRPKGVKGRSKETSWKTTAIMLGRKGPSAWAVTAHGPLPRPGEYILWLLQFCLSDLMQISLVVNLYSQSCQEDNLGTTVLVLLSQQSIQTSQRLWIHGPYLKGNT